MQEEDADGGVMEEETACSPCGRAFGTDLGEEAVREDVAEEGGYVGG